MSLLGDLWGGARRASVGGNSGQESGRLEIERKALRRKDISYVQAVSSSSSDDRKKKTDPTMLGDSAISKGKELGENGWILVQHKKRKSTSPNGGRARGGCWRVASVRGRRGAMWTDVTGVSGPRIPPQSAVTRWFVGAVSVLVTLQSIAL